MYKVGKIFDSPQGKFDNDVTNAILMEYDSFLKHVLTNVNPNMVQSRRAILSTIDLNHYARSFLFFHSSYYPRENDIESSISKNRRLSGQ